MAGGHIVELESSTHRRITIEATDQSLPCFPASISFSHVCALAETSMIDHHVFFLDLN